MAVQVGVNGFYLREFCDREAEKARKAIEQINKSLPYMTGPMRAETRKNVDTINDQIRQMEQTKRAIYGCWSLDVQWAWDKELKRRLRALPFWKFKARREADWDRDEWIEAEWKRREAEAAAIDELVI